MIYAELEIELQQQMSQGTSYLPAFAREDADDWPD